MKKATRALLAIAIAVLAAVSLLTFPACSNGGKANDIEHISTKGLEYAAGAEENTCVVAGMGTAVEQDIIIPGVYQGKKVVGIKDEAFRESNIRSVVIPDSVTSIGWGAFYECSSLTSIMIPNGVTSIGDWTFSHCSSLTSITIPNSVTSIGRHVFWNCSSLTSITIPNSVTSIGSSAFSWCSSLTSITIPNSVTSIEIWTFSDCKSLTSITIPNSVTSIDHYAFYDCSSLTQVNYKGTEEQWNKIQIGFDNSCLKSAQRNYI